MNVNRTTAIFVVVALVSVGLAIITLPTQADDKASGENAVGTEFYASFKEPGLCKSIEVATFNATTQTPSVFHVEFRDGEWVIPSHYMYPADGERKVAAAAVNYIDVKRGPLRSANPLDHEALGVIDPLDDNAATKGGQGKRITFKDASGKALVDYIVGKEVQYKSGFHYTRIPGQNAVYEAKISDDINTSFDDWVEKDILKLSSWKISSITVNNYAVAESGGFGGAHFVPEDTLRITKDKDRKWVCAELTAGTETNEEPIKDLVKTVDMIKFVGVKPKPTDGQFDIVKFLQDGNAFKLTPPAKEIAPGRGTASIGEGEGFYYDRVNGMLLGGAGDCTIATDSGIVYLLTWGRIVIDVADDESSDGKNNKKVKDAPKGERHYLCVTAFLDESLVPEPKKPEAPAPKSHAPRDDKGAPTGDGTKPADGTKPDESTKPVEGTPAESPEDAAYRTALKEWGTKHKTWEDDLKKTRDEVKDLQQRLAKWYYIIPDEDYKKIRLSRSDVEKKINIDDDKDMVDLEQGLKYKDLKVGDGAVADVGKTIKVKYVGKLTDGTIFDQTQDAPATFGLNPNGLIKGWVKGIPGMKVGGKRKLVIPPALGYGAKGSPPKIGPNATLVFEIELMGVE